MAKGDYQLAWKKYEFTDETIDHCKTVVMTEVNERSEKYWENCANFVKSIKYLQMGRLNVKQRNWAMGIRRDLRNKGYWK